MFRACQSLMAVAETISVPLQQEHPMTERSMSIIVPVVTTKMHYCVWLLSSLVSCSHTMSIVLNPMDS